MIRDRGPSPFRRRHAGVQSLPEAVPPAGAHGGISHMSSAGPDAGRDALLLRVSLSHRQRRHVHVSEIRSSLIAPKSASGHHITAIACKVAILAKLRTPEQHPTFGKSAIQASALREMLVKDHIRVWSFLHFTELIPL